MRKSIDVRLTRVAVQVAWLSTDFDRHLISGLLVHRFFRFKWFGCRMIWDSGGLVVKWFEIPMIWMSIDLKFKWFGCQLIWNSSGWVINWSQVTWDSLILIWFSQFIWDSSDAVVDWSEIQLIGLPGDLNFQSWLSLDLRVKWFGCRVIWTSSDLVINWFFESQMIQLSTGLNVKCFGRSLIWESNDAVVEWSEVQVQVFRTNSKVTKTKTAKCFWSKKTFMILSANAQTPQPKKTSSRLLHDYSNVSWQFQTHKKKNTAKAFFLLDEAQTEWGLHASGHVRSVQTHTSLPMRRQ